MRITSGNYFTVLDAEHRASHSPGKHATSELTLQSPGEETVSGRHLLESEHPRNKIPYGLSDLRELFPLPFLGHSPSIFTPTYTRAIAGVCKAHVSGMDTNSA